MEYITTKQASEKWSISTNRITILAKGGRIPGAIKFNSQWMIPMNASKPIDGRTKESPLQEAANELIRFPFYAGRNVSSFNPPLSDEELELKKILDAYMACRFEEARDLLSALPKTTNNLFTRIFTLYYACLIAIQFSNYGEIFDIYAELTILMQKNFPHRKEIEILLHEADACLGANSYFINEFHVDSDYSYHPDFMAHLTVMSCFSIFISDVSRLVANDLIPYELSCANYEREGYYSDSLAIHLYLSLIFALMDLPEKMMSHLNSALTLAEKYELYWLPSMQYYYFKNIFDTALVDFSDDFASTIRDLAADVHERFTRFTSMESFETVLNILSSKDFILVYYAIQNKTNKEIAALLGISEKTVSKKYSIIYETLGISGKGELVNLYKSSINNSFINK